MEPSTPAATLWSGADRTRPSRGACCLHRNLELRPHCTTDDSMGNELCACFGDGDQTDNSVSRHHPCNCPTIPSRSIASLHQALSARPITPFDPGVRWTPAGRLGPPTRRLAGSHPPPPPRLMRARPRPSQDRPSDTKLLERFKVRSFVGPHAPTRTPPLPVRPARRGCR